MQAYKLTGKVDADGNLIVTEAVTLPPGDVEVIVLQPKTSSTTQSNSAQSDRLSHVKSKFLREWLAKTEPAPDDFDADAARWEALKEKHGL
jgi:hypothetical protein